MERRALTDEARAENDRKQKTRKRKLAGEKNVPWNAHEDELYELIMDMFGGEALKVRIKQTLPQACDFGRVSHMNVRTYEELDEYIKDNCWTGERATFTWKIFSSGWLGLGGDEIQKQESPEQRVRWANKLKNAAQTASVNAGQSAPQSQAQPAVVSVQPDLAATNMLMHRLEMLERKVDEDEEEDEDEDDHKASAVPTPPTDAKQPEATPMADQNQEFEQFNLPDGSVAWRSKQERPPEGYPPPPDGYAYKKIGGRWQFIQIQTPAVPVAPPAAPVAQATAPTQQVFSPPPGAVTPQELAYLEKAHKLEVDLEVLKATAKTIEAQRKKNEQEETPAPQTPSAHSTSSGPPAPPPGFGYTQVSGQWVLVPLSASGAPVAQATPAAAPATITSMARDLGAAKKAIESVFGGGGSEAGTGGYFPKAGEAAGAAAEKAADDIPLKPFPIGSDMNLFWNSDDRKFVDGGMQLILNGPGILGGFKGLVKDGLAEYRKIHEDSDRKRQEQHDRNKREAKDALDRQREAIERLATENEQLKRERYRTRTVERVVEVPDPEPEPAHEEPPVPEPEPPPEPPKSISSMMGSGTKW